MEGSGDPPSAVQEGKDMTTAVESLVPSKAFNSVQRAMIKVQENAKQRSLQIKTLRSEKKDLLQKLKAYEQKMKTSGMDLEAFQKQIKELTETKTELERSLSSEQAAFMKLKDDSTHAINEVKLLKLQNLKMVERQTEEKNIRNELARELHKMQKEIVKVSEEKAVVEKRYDELGLKLKTEVEGFEREKQQWKEKHLHTLKRLQREEEQVQDGATIAQGMAADLMVVNKENEQLKGLLEEQETELRNIMVEYQRAQDAMTKINDENKALQTDKELLKKTNTEGEKELKKSAEQLRIMAEKVFQLLNQLQKLDNWKKEALGKQKAADHKIELLKVKSENLEEQLKNTVKTNKQLHASLKSSNARMEKYRDISRDHKSRYMACEKTRSKLSSQVKGANKLLHKLQSQTDHLTTKYRQEQHKNAAQLQSIQKLQTTLMNHELNRHNLDNRLKSVAAEMKEKDSELKQRDELVHLYREQDKHINKLKSLMAAVDKEDVPPHMLNTMEELQAVRDRIKAESAQIYGENAELNEKTAIAKIRKETTAPSIVKKAESKFGSAKKKPTIRRVTSKTQTRNRRKTGRGLSVSGKRGKKVVKRSSSSARATTVRVRTLFRSLAKEGNGPELKRMMKSLQVDETTVVRWISDPKELIGGLRKVYRRVNTREKKAKAMENQFAGVSKKLEMVEKKNKSLIAKVNATEESKTKVVMRFANVLAGIANLTKNLIEKEQNEEATTTGEGKGAFLTQDPSEGGESGGIPPSVMARDLPGVANLQMANNGIEDAEAVLIANALHDNQAVTEVLVRSNRIGDKGFVALGVACLSAKSNVTMLDAQFNHVTLKGVETFATMLSEFADSSGHVLRASFEKEKGVLIPVIQVHIRGPRKLTVDLRFNKLKPELPDGASQAAIKQSEKDADAQLLKIVRILSRCGRASVAHEAMLRKEADYERRRQAGELTVEEQRLVLHGGWTGSKGKPSTKKLISKNARHKRGQSRRTAANSGISVSVKGTHTPTHTQTNRMQHNTHTHTQHT
uniref:Uncharacterized protein n=1 Tax=Lotharella globosa TaxID=91324 RepID=A0A7S4DQ35_9EUKA